MATDLYKLPGRDKWAVRSEDGEVHAFESIEAACDHMERIGIVSDEIDFALVMMAQQATIHAHFGVFGKFIMADNKAIAVGQS